MWQVINSLAMVQMYHEERAAGNYIYTLSLPLNNNYIFKTGFLRDLVNKYEFAAFYFARFSQDLIIQKLYGLCPEPNGLYLPSATLVGIGVNLKKCIEFGIRILAIPSEKKIYLLLKNGKIIKGL